jgi:hypothetical protein
MRYAYQPQLFLSSLDLFAITKDSMVLGNRGGYSRGVHVSTS